MRHYWNEIDPYAAAWLRNLIDAGELPPGDVDTRSIKDVTPEDVRGYRQCHFFAGGGLWSFALRYAGWPDGRECWTGSCPCQPFSPAGKQKGKADERHLWPDFFRLIDACRPACVFGEQVPAAVRHGWLDDLCDDLEGVGYTTRAIDLPACSIGSPTIRQRLFWGASRVSDAGRIGGERRPSEFLPGEAGPTERIEEVIDGERSGADGGVSGTEGSGLHGTPAAAEPHGRNGPEGRGSTERLPGTTSGGFGELRGAREPWSGGHADGGGEDRGILLADGSRRDAGRTAAATAGYRSAVEPTSRFSSDACGWLDFLDGKTRPIEPGLECLVDGVPFRLADGRAGRSTQSRAKILKVIGNAILPSVGAAFIRAYCESVRAA